MALPKRNQPQPPPTMASTLPTSTTVINNNSSFIPRSVFKKLLVVIVACLTLFNYVTNNSVLRSVKKPPNVENIQHTSLRTQQNSNTSIGIQHQYENKSEPEAEDYTIKNATSEIKEQPNTSDKKPPPESHDVVKERPETTNQSNPNKTSKPDVSLPNVILIEAGTSSVSESKD